ncbi:MAG: HEAT repeat domain-containing protein [Nitrospirota bacterium]
MLVNQINSSDGNKRKAAVSALGELKDPCAIEPLIKALGDEDYVVIEFNEFIKFNYLLFNSLNSITIYRMN